MFVSRDWCGRYCNALASVPILYADVDFCAFFGIVRGEHETPELMLKSFTKNADKCAPHSSSSVILHFVTLSQGRMDAEARRMEHGVEAAVVCNEFWIPLLF